MKKLLISILTAVALSAGAGDKLFTTSDSVTYKITGVREGPALVVEEQIRSDKGLKSSKSTVDLSECCPNTDKAKSLKYLRSLLAGGKYKIEERFGGPSVILPGDKLLQDALKEWAAANQIQPGEKNAPEEAKAEAETTEDNSPYRMKFDFAGLVPGCKKSEALRVMRESGRTKLISSQEKERGETVYVFSGNNQLNGVAETELVFWQGRLYRISMDFYKPESSSCVELENAVKKGIEDKWGEMKRSRGRYDRSDYFEIEDNIKKINLFWGNKHLILSYTNLALQNGTPETIKEKASKIGKF